MKVLFLTILCLLLILCLAAPADQLNQTKRVKHLARVELNTTLLQVPFHYESEIGYYILCDTLGRKTEKCPIILDQETKKDGDPIMAVCESAFSAVGGLLLQGCGTHTASYVKQMCTVDRCGSHARSGDVHYCCCLGHRCNSNYYVRKTVEDRNK